MSAAQKATTQSGKDREEKPKTSSARASKKDDVPRLGERDGRFYMRFRIAGEGQIPTSTHDDCAVEVRLFATNDAWRPTSDEYAVESDEVVDGMHEVVYSVPVERNLTREGEERAKERAKAERAEKRAAKS